jgi:hypothetical protein
MRTSRKAVTFLRSFILKDVDGDQPPGTYVVVTDEEPIPGLLFTGWRRVMTTLRLPAIGVDTGQEQVVTIDPHDLATALTNDAKAPV